jgi:hypothetical protein
MYYELTDHFEVAADIDRCWQFFGSADLPLITPPWLNFSIAMPTPLLGGRRSPAHGAAQQCISPRAQ